MGRQPPAAQVPHGVGPHPRHRRAAGVHDEQPQPGRREHLLQQPERHDPGRLRAADGRRAHADHPGELPLAQVGPPARPAHEPADVEVLAHGFSVVGPGRRRQTCGRICGRLTACGRRLANFPSPGSTPVRRRDQSPPDRVRLCSPCRSRVVRAGRGCTQPAHRRTGAPSGGAEAHRRAACLVATPRGASDGGADAKRHAGGLLARRVRIRGMGRGVRVGWGWWCLGGALVGQAGPIMSATMRAERATRGRPPPGWAEPPARKTPLTGERFGGRRNAERAPLEDVP